MDYYRITRSFVFESFCRAGQPQAFTHLERTVYWLLQLRPSAAEALRIAAVAHDIERSRRTDETAAMLRTSPLGFADPAFIEQHSRIGAQIISDFLEQQHAPKDLIERVAALIKAHETGGDEEQNDLRDADSISFFENNVEAIIDKHLQGTGESKLRAKLDYMFDRIGSGKARKTAQPMHQAALDKLKQITG